MLSYLYTVIRKRLQFIFTFITVLETVGMTKPSLHAGTAIFFNLGYFMLIINYEVVDFISHVQLKLVETLFVCEGSYLLSCH